MERPRGAREDRLTPPGHAGGGAPDAHAHVRRGVVLAVCCLSMFIGGLDSTILNVALPAIRSDFDASIAGAQWTIDSYMLVIACLLMLSGSTADRIGRRRTFQAGLAAFTIGSLLCSLASSLGLLIAFRALQAIGGSMLNPVAMSIVSNTFTDPRDRARAIGWWGAIGGISIAAGPVIGGALVNGVGWRSIFWINVPIGIAAIALVARFVPESRAPRPRRPDPLAELFVIGLLGTLVYGTIEAPAHGWGSPAIVGCFAAAAVCLVGLIVHELRRDEPLVDMRFFRSAPFSGATAICVCTFAAIGGFLFLNTLYLQEVRHHSALQAGLSLLPMAGLMMISAPLSGRAIGRWGPRPSLLLGSLGLLTGGLLIAAADGLPADPRLYAGYVLVGFGLGTTNAAITNTAVSGMPLAQAGVAAAIASTCRQVGVALGVAVIGSVIAERTASVTAGPGFTAAWHVSWWMIAGCGACCLALAAATTGARGRRSAARTAAALQFAPEPR